MTTVDLLVIEVWVHRASGVNLESSAAVTFENSALLIV